MASIFTFDPDPPRVSSPWATATPPSGRLPRQTLPKDSKPAEELQGANNGQAPSLGSILPAVDYTTITRLEAEPQEGPTEYKLHLLLRRRRSFTRSSTKGHVSGSFRRNDPPVSVPTVRSASDSGLLSSTPPPSTATQSRQHRLEQLTTQMLWRLQQSCPYHTSSSTAGVLLQFPDESQLSSPIVAQRLYPGLEESKGALYEIGVADDGELVGLAEDEMEESLNNLRAMAASLGCCVQVQHMVSVGDCEWIDDAGAHQPRIQKSKLLVAEALVRPDQPLIDQEHSKSGRQPDPAGKVTQLRVSLTGATMSGKSSLLGTLSTGTLDNGRGKSRLSLLKHRHEIESGVTSSITQELIGYRDVFHETVRAQTQVVNYGSSDVSSWVDVHAAAESTTAGRLVFLTDSAGHPRFRRTTVRGLVGWDPHYTLLCIPADNAEDSSGKIGASPNSKEIPAHLDLAHEHLQLCLSLELPLLVVVTKYDLATKAGLKAVIRKLLDALKEAGRTGRIIADPSTSITEADLHAISSNDLIEANEIVQALESSPLAIVPIILTSALKGTGLRKLHAFLRELPIPRAPEPPPTAPSILFHIEDQYTDKATRKPNAKEPIIIGGHVRYGTLTVGDELMLGPYRVDTSSDDSDSGCGRPSGRSRNSPVPTSRSFPGALHKRSSGSALHLRAGPASLTEWRRVRITSLRNLRLPVRALQAGQVGSIGIVSTHAHAHVPIASPTINRIDRGMVLVDSEPQAQRIISVRFIGVNAESVRSLSIGSAVVVFVASARASAKVVSVTPVSMAEAGSALTHNIRAEKATAEEEDDEGFGFDFGFDEERGYDPSDGNIGNSATAEATVVTFQFIASREFVETRAKVLVMPGGGPGLSGNTERGEKGVAGLEGFVGRVVDQYS